MPSTFSEQNVVVHSADPLLIEFDSELSDTIFDRLSEESNYFPSLGYDAQTNSGRVTDYRRSQTFCDMKKKFNIITKMLLGRVYDLTEHQYFVEQTEEIQLTKYSPGEYFKPHWDNFNMGDVKRVRNDRVATIILYLNDNFIGGETVFTELDVTIRPKRGKVCYFAYPIGSKSMSLLKHEARPIISGEKNIIQIWIRDKEWTG